MKTLQILMMNKKISGWDISTASYDNKSFSVGSQDATPAGLFFKPDGTKMYITGYQKDVVFQYSLSTAWDVSTASYDSKSFSVSNQDTSAWCLFFKSDGAKMYFVGRGSDRVYQYSLSTAWDVSTASYDKKSFGVGNQDGDASGLFFKSDGAKMYFVGFGSDRVYQYSLSTAWDVSTASYDSKSFSVSNQDTSAWCLFFKSDGTKMYIVGDASDRVYQYSLSTAWDVSTASYDSKSFSVSSQDTNHYSLFFKSDGTKMYIAGDGPIYQYSLS